LKSRLTEILEEKSLTRLDLQYLARCGPNLIRGIEKFGWKPRPAVAEKIARVLNVKVSDIWPEGGE
jgi:DNA-binding XRE family transcriptional regulator